MNFNIVKKPQKTDEDDDILDEDEIELEEEKTTKNTDDAKKKMFRFMGIIIGVMILLLIILYVVSLLSNRNYTYDEVETVVKDAAISYFKDNPDSLPVDEGSIVEIDSSNLVAAEKMKDLSEYPVNGVACSAANVQVEKTGDSYLYTPYLNCGEKYATTELYKKVLEEKNIVTTGYGLYANGGGYSYRGEQVNNYVKLDNSIWRIIKVTGDNNVVLIHDSGITYSQPWDDRYNESRLYESGINNYNASRIKEYLEKVYSNPSKDDGEDILSDNDKAKIVTHNVCTGKRSLNSESKDNSEECLETVQDQKLSLLTISDYLYASLDENCKTPGNKSCKNYNYLSKVEDWWLVTANKDDTSTVFKVNQSGVVVTDNASTYSIVRPVIYLNSRAMYKSGDGSKEKPYNLK